MRRRKRRRNSDRRVRVLFAFALLVLVVQLVVIGHRSGMHWPLTGVLLTLIGVFTLAMALFRRSS